MRFWFDTEFYEDGSTIKLISIGVVAEDGRTYYAEPWQAFERAQQTIWLQENVAPHLKGGEKPRYLIAEELVAFMGEKPEIWAYYADYDWVVLCQLFGRMIDLPEGWPKICYDLRQWLDMNGHKQVKQPELAPHDALLDAVWAMETAKQYDAKCL